MGDSRAFHVKAVRASPGPVDELVANDELARLDVCLKAARRVGPDNPIDSQLFESPYVGAVVDRGRWDGVLRTVARQEGDPPAGHGADRDAVAGLTVRRAEFDQLDVVQELVEPRPPEHSDAGRARCVRHAN